ncbi:hypothetical protein D0X99_20075 [Algoriphagus lacus]|uniref:Tetratricopeptide repeat protein 21A/21B fifth ARM repeats domain-containing protein n=1 Tax=Algoriphagus lacus TaxID=2056311 RepID=A0A418PLL8_9BACT|nr:tetratricopeptide repeat protein [Algoriphagus lacus]RIW11976.1 hypothetical protein D0X99_20075 [Algoriphagus lacus]
MKIIYPRNKFLSRLFPTVDITNDEQLIHAFRKYLSLGEFIPNVEISESEVIIEIPSNFLLGDPREFQRVNELCSRKKFAEARPILEKLVQKYPSISEYHRTLAQTYEEEGQHEKAIDILIDALRWDPKNHWALILMGNIYARYKDDPDTAMAFYDQVIHADPGNFIALNNIGGALVQNGKLDLGEKYLKQAFDINPEYPNTCYALGLVAEMKGENLKAFEYCAKAVKYSNSSKDPIFQNGLQTALESAKKITDSDYGKEELVDFINELEELTGKEIRIEKDENIPTAAVVQIAENHNRDYHLIKFKPALGIDHLILHELVHILFYHEARKIQENKLFIAKAEKLQEFKRKYSRYINSLIRKGYDEDQVSKMFEELFHGILRQVFNAPIDLFIEDLIFEKFPTLRPHQFLSLFRLSTEAYNAVSIPRVEELLPAEILSQSKVYNVLGARHTDSLLGTRFEEKYSINAKEKELVKSLWDEFLEYRQDREPGEEYELVEHWGADLGLDAYFSLIDEESHRVKAQKPSTKSPEEVMAFIEQDPNSIEGYSEEEDQEMAEFLASHSDKDLNTAVAFYMVDALEYFSKLSIEKVKEIAFEVAMLGQSGIDPKKKGYRLNKIPGQVFSGYKLLAYYYVSWAKAIPQMLSQLQMPFDEEYQLAQSIFESDK